MCACCWRPPATCPRQAVNIILQKQNRIVASCSWRPLAAPTGESGRECVRAAGGHWPPLLASRDGNACVPLAAAGRPYGRVGTGMRACCWRPLAAPTGESGRECVRAAGGRWPPLRALHTGNLCGSLTAQIVKLKARIREQTGDNQRKTEIARRKIKNLVFLVDRFQKL